MNQRSEILDELKTISPLIAGIDNINVFTVPEGYFETVGNTVLVCLKEENTLLNDTMQENDVPADYFTNLPGAILAKIKAGEAISATAELEEISTVLASVKKTNPFELPGQYFESLSSAIAFRMDSEDAPAALNNIKAMQPFDLPKGYFAGLPSAILAKVRNRQEAPVVGMFRRSVLIKYAAAAIITGALALGVVKYANRSVTTINETAQLDPSIEKGKNMDDKKFDETLNNLSEEDIAQYLENNGSDADIAVLISNVEENTLPRPEDYLIDDATLENLLQEIDTQKLEN